MKWGTRYLVGYGCARLRAFGDAELTGLGQDDDFLGETVAEAILLDFEVVARLEVQPEPLRRPEVARETQGGVGRDRALPVHYLVDPSRWDAGVLGDTVLRDLERFDELLEQDLARMHRCELCLPSQARRFSGGQRSRPHGRHPLSTACPREAAAVPAAERPFPCRGRGPAEMIPTPARMSTT